MKVDPPMPSTQLRPDRYAERVARGECAWCETQAAWTVEFDACGHVTPCCEDHHGEYFLGIGWEDWWPPEEFDPTCPACAG